MTERQDEMKSLLREVADGNSLVEKDAERAFNIIMSGDASPAQIGAFLMALRVRGETVDELTGAVRVMRQKALHVSAPENAIDIVGTGGDSSGTYNISTAAALVVAAAGVPVAKHGNRALSSKCGSADVLAALGVNIDADIDFVEKAIQEAGVGFLMAPRHHSAMRHVAGPRVELGDSNTVQSSRTYVQSGRGETSIFGRLRSPMDRTDGTGTGKTGQRARLGGTWRGWSR